MGQERAESDKYLSAIRESGSMMFRDFSYMFDCQDGDGEDGEDEDGEDEGVDTGD